MRDTNPKSPHGVVVVSTALGAFTGVGVNWLAGSMFSTVNVMLPGAIIGALVGLRISYSR